MPKGKRRGKSDRRFQDLSVKSDDESVNDNASEFSSQSEAKSLEEEDTTELQDQFEERLLEMIDNLNQKSSQGRVNCFHSVSKAIVSKYMPSFVLERHFTLCDSIERSLKKGGTDERSAAADLASLICVQLGAEDASQEVCKTLKSVLLTTALNNAVAPSARGKCCIALSIIYFLTDAEIGDILSLMQHLESIFSGSYLKGDGSVPNVPTDVANLHANALSAWALLVTNIDPNSVLMMITSTKTIPSIKQFAELMESQHLEVRLTAGEVLALLFELGRDEEDEDFTDDFACIVDTLKGLATDSHKYRAKKDRKQQRATFRDILMFIQEDAISDVQVKFGKETLVLDSWTKRKQYDMMCSVLGPGINIHLAENEFLRDIFEISDPIIQNPEVTTYAQNQMNRFRKRLANAANFKARTLSRAKNRDKRSDF